jgi:hypothetical protein
LIDDLKTGFSPEEVYRSEIRQQVEGKLWIVMQCGKNRWGIVTVHNAGLDAV